MNVNQHQSLEACPTSSNGISSQANRSDKEHYIEPLLTQTSNTRRSVLNFRA